MSCHIFGTKISQFRKKKIENLVTEYGMHHNRGEKGREIHWINVAAMYAIHAHAKQPHQHTDRKYVFAHVEMSLLKRDLLAFIRSIRLNNMFICFAMGKRKREIAMESERTSVCVLCYVMFILSSMHACALYFDVLCCVCVELLAGFDDDAHEPMIAN